MKENRLFAGMWYGSRKPDMSLFLRPLAETLKKLYNDGMCVVYVALCCFTTMQVLLSTFLDVASLLPVQHLHVALVTCLQKQ